MNSENLDIFNLDILKGKIILVTGASSGIGKLTSELLLRYGANIVVTSREKDKLINNLSFDSNERVLPIQADLSDEDSGFKLISSLPSNWLPLDGIFHAAGEVLLKPLSIATPFDFHSLAAPVINCSISFGKAASNARLFNNGSSIVLMSSVASEFGTLGMTHYSAVKAALRGVTVGMATELAAKNIRVNNIAAGAVNTPMHANITSKLTEESILSYKEKHLLGFGKSEDIANMVIYLMSPASRWITGSTIRVDGGFSCFK